MLVPREEFHLDNGFISEYRDRQPAWGSLGYIVYKRTYAELLPDGSTEEYWQTCQRVIEGMYQIQKGHCRRHGLPWNDSKAQRSAQDAFTRMFAFKWLPPGRGMSKMGSEHMFKIGGACLNNCGFYTTANIGNTNIPNAFSQPFTWLMDCSMLGVGVGLDTRGKGTVKIIKPYPSDKPFVVGDSREGWIEYVRELLQSYVDPDVLCPINPDYSLVRPKGARIRGFGGTASGPEALVRLTTRVRTLLDAYKGKYVDARVIVDIANSIGECVVAGGVRRTAEILFSEPTDTQFLGLKDYTNPETNEWPRWASNNSVFVDTDTDFSGPAKLTAMNGEPGYAFLKNAQAYSRMCDPPDNKDHKAMGGNPCFAADTLIAVADGRNAVPIKQLVDAGQDVPVYCIDNAGDIQIRMARNPRVTQENVPLVRITISDGTSLIVTPSHEMLLADSTYRNAGDLVAGDTLPRLVVPKHTGHVRADIKTELKTCRIGAQDHVTRVCNVCLRSYLVAMGERHNVHCSPVCYALTLAKKQARREGKRTFTLNLAATVQVLDVTPVEGTHTVYNLTVEDFHTVGIVTRIEDGDKPHVSGIFTSQCLEQTLHSAELCCLVETFPHKCDNYEDYQRTLKCAYLYAKTVTLVPTHCEETNAVMLRNRRIGCSQSGIQDNIAKIGLRNHMLWCNTGYQYINRLDEIYSDWLCIPKSIKKTSVKPSGSISKLVGCREGIHHEKSEYILQAIRINDDSVLIEPLRHAGYRIETAVNEANTVVVYFPVHTPGQRPSETITMWEQLEVAALMQYYWADNQVSVTIDFDKEKEGPFIQQALEMYAHRLKGVSFLPRNDHGYVQAPKTVITREEYLAYQMRLQPYSFAGLKTHEVDDKYCDGGLCTIPPVAGEEAAE